MLVDSDVFNKVRISYLMKGHSHEDVELFLARFLLGFLAMLVDTVPYLFAHMFLLWCHTSIAS